MSRFIETIKMQDVAMETKITCNYLKKKILMYF